MKNDSFLKRINLKGPLPELLKRVCAAFDVGKYQSYKIVAVGYEDLNIIITTNQGKYLAKFFAKDRRKAEILRYVSILEKIQTVPKLHPTMYKCEKGIYYKDSVEKSVSMVLMDFIDGKTFWDLRRSPNKKETQQIIRSVAQIHKMDFHPKFVFDSWAVQNLEQAYTSLKKFLSDDEKALLEGVRAKFKKIPLKKLPHCFVHGDVLQTNVITSNSGEIYILDYSVANWYPRIQDLAVLASGLLYDKRSLKERVEFTQKEYEKHQKLTPLEREHLYMYAVTANAMEFLGAATEKFKQGNTSRENEFWLKLGKEGLRRDLKAA